MALINKLRSAGIFALALASASCAVNSAGKYRNLIITPGDAFVTQVTRYKVENDLEENSLVDLEPICVVTGARPEEIPLQLSPLREMITKNEPHYYEILEDLVEGTMSELMEEKIDFSSPHYGGDYYGIQIVNRKTREIEYTRQDEEVQYTPFQLLALRYLAEHLLGKIEDVEVESPSFQNFFQAFTVYLTASEKELTAKKILVWEEEKKYFQELGLTLSEAIQNAINYDADVRPYLGFGTSPITINIVEEDRTIEAIMQTYFHELGHKIFRNKFFFSSLNYGLSEEKKTLEENACEIIEKKAREYLQKNKLNRLNEEWMRWRINPRKRHPLPEEMERYFSLFRSFEKKQRTNVATEIIDRRYNSLQDQLMIVYDYVPFPQFVDLIGRMNDFSQLNLVLKLVQEKKSYEYIKEEL